MKYLVLLNGSVTSSVYVVTLAMVLLPCHHHYHLRGSHHTSLTYCQYWSYHHHWEQNIENSTVIKDMHQYYKTLNKITEKLSQLKVFKGNHMHIKAINNSIIFDQTKSKQKLEVQQTLCAIHVAGSWTSQFQVRWLYSMDKLVQFFFKNSWANSDYSLSSIYMYIYIYMYMY